MTFRVGKEDCKVNTRYNDGMERIFFDFPVPEYEYCMVPEYHEDSYNRSSMANHLAFNCLSALSAKYSPSFECTNGMFDIADDRLKNHLPDMKRNRTLSDGMLKFKGVGDIGIYGVDRMSIDGTHHDPWVRLTGSHLAKYLNRHLKVAPVGPSTNSYCTFERNGRTSGLIKVDTVLNIKDWSQRQIVKPFPPRTVYAGPFMSEHLANCVPMIGIPGTWKAGRIGLSVDNSHPLQVFNKNGYLPKWKRTGKTNPRGCFQLKVLMAIGAKSKIRSTLLSGDISRINYVQEFVKNKSKQVMTLKASMYKRIHFMPNRDSEDSHKDGYARAHGWDCVPTNRHDGFVTDLFKLCGLQCHMVSDHSIPETSIFEFRKEWVYICKNNPLTTDNIKQAQLQIMLSKQSKGICFAEGQSEASFYSDGVFTRKMYDALTPRPVLKDGSIFASVVSLSVPSIRWLLWMDKTDPNAMKKTSDVSDRSDRCKLQVL